MPDWKKFANLLGMAQHGDAVRGERERIRKEGIQAEELGFRRDANTRAGAAEGRAAEDDRYNDSRRFVKEEADRLAIKAAQHKDSRQPAVDEREDEDQKFQREQNARAEKQLQALIHDQSLRRAQQAQHDADRKKVQDRAGEDQKIQRGNQQSTFDERNDPSAPKRQRADQLMKIIEGSGDGERVNAAKAELARLNSDFERDQVVRGIKRDQVSR